MSTNLLIQAIITIIQPDTFSIVISAITIWCSGTLNLIDPPMHQRLASRPLLCIYRHQRRFRNTLSVLGILTDWDMASELREEGEVPNSAALHRTGTLAFVATDSSNAAAALLLSSWFGVFFLHLNLGSRSLWHQEENSTTDVQAVGPVGR